MRLAGRYFVEAVSVLGPVILSRIRRTTDLQVFLMETFAVYLSFSAAAWWLGEKTFLYEQAGFVRLAIPTTVTVVVLLLCNAYAGSAKQSSLLRPILQSAGSLAIAFLGQAVVFDLQPSFAVPAGIMLYGTCTSLVLVATLRMLFPPFLNGRPQVVALHQPRIARTPNFIRQRELARIVEQKISTQPLPRFRMPIALIVVLLAGGLVFSIAGYDGSTLLKPQHLLIVLIIVVVVMFSIRSRD